MPAEGARRRRKSTRRPIEDSSTARTEPRKHESFVPPEPETSERPATLEDLREARLKFLTTAQGRKQGKMKSANVKTVKAKSVDPPDTAPTEGKVPSKSRSTRKAGDRKTESKSRRSSDHRQEDDGHQYVYGPPSAREQVPGAFDAKLADPQGGSTGVRTRSTATPMKTGRTQTRRRNTEPVIQSNPARRKGEVKRDVKTDAKSNVSSEIRSAPRPPLRKSTATLPSSPRSMTQRGSIPGAFEADSATVMSTTSAAKRPGSIFGGLFASKPQPVDRKVSCLTCGDDVSASKAAKLPCAHRMCHACLKRLFKLSVTDPAHMPPRCCTEQPISLKHVDSLFDDGFKKTYNRKYKEYNTKNKIYCPARECGEWIQPKHMIMDKGRKIGRCPACKLYVCAICNQKMHKKRDCPKDPATKEFAETAKKAGWQKCYNCAAMVELKEGCNHMTCRCTAEFCMMCGLKWKSCDCPWFSYEQVDANGDPIRYQQEMDRRRDQERRDEAIARRMDALQLDDERPMFFEWLNLGNVAGQRMDAQRRGMPGAWDDGPQQFQQVPLDPRRHRQAELDPAAFADIQAERIGPDNVRVVRHRMQRGRDTASPAIAFEGRALTAEEREQERRIRAWATGGSNV